MSTTFLQATNEILAASNEVQLNSGNFSSPVGIQEVAKNAISRAYLEICGKEVEWPFLRAGESNVNDPYDGNVTLETVAGTRWYLLKTTSTSVAGDYSKIDWDSFYLTTEGATGASAPYVHEDLTFTTFQDWVDRFRESENRDAGDGQTYGQPRRVVRSKDGRYFGLSPIPDGVYGVYFTAWVRATKLSAHGDVLLIPDEYVPVLYSRGSYYLNKFKGDYNAMSADNAAYEKLIREMRRNLMGPQEVYMRDDRIIRR